MDVKKKLEEELRSIYDNDEFIMCVIGQAKSEKSYQTLLAFIDKTREEGADATCEDMIGMSLLLRERLDAADYEQAEKGVSLYRDRLD